MKLKKIKSKGGQKLVLKIKRKVFHKIQNSIEWLAINHFRVNDSLFFKFLWFENELKNWPEICLIKNGSCHDEIQTFNSLAVQV